MKKGKRLGIGLYLIAYAYNNNNQLLTETTGGTTATFAYDLNGNLLSKTTGGNTTNYTWDGRNYLLSVSGADGNTAYSYDGDGARISKTQNGVKTKFINDVALPLVQVIMETTDANVVQAVYNYGNDLISMNRLGVNSFYHYDGLGSTRQLTNSSGAVVANYIYDSFGNSVSSVSSVVNSYGFTGEQQFGEAENMVFLRARYYNSRIGRFINRDPIKYKGGLNLYRYVRNNPVNKIDPLGLGGGATTCMNTCDELLLGIGNVNMIRACEECCMDKLGTDEDNECARNTARECARNAVADPRNWDPTPPHAIPRPPSSGNSHTLPIYFIIILCLIGFLKKYAFLHIRRSKYINRIQFILMIFILSVICFDSMAKSNSLRFGGPFELSPNEKILAMNIYEESGDYENAKPFILYLDEPNASPIAIPDINMFSQMCWLNKDSSKLLILGYNRTEGYTATFNISKSGVSEIYRCTLPLGPLISMCFCNEDQSILGLRITDINEGVYLGISRDICKGFRNTHISMRGGGYPGWTQNDMIYIQNKSGIHEVEIDNEGNAKINKTFSCGPDAHLVGSIGGRAIYTLENEIIFVGEKKEVLYKSTGKPEDCGIGCTVSGSYIEIREGNDIKILDQNGQLVHNRQVDRSSVKVIALASKSKYVYLLNRNHEVIMRYSFEKNGVIEMVFSLANKK